MGGNTSSMVFGSNSGDWLTQPVIQWGITGLGLVTFFATIQDNNHGSFGLGYTKDGAYHHVGGVSFSNN